MPNHPNMLRRQENNGNRDLGDVSMQKATQQHCKGRNPLMWPYKFSFQSNLNPFTASIAPPKITSSDRGELFSRNPKSGDLSAAPSSYYNFSKWWGSTASQKKAHSTKVHVAHPMNKNSVKPSGSSNNPRQSSERFSLSRNANTKACEENKKLHGSTRRYVETKLRTFASDETKSDKTGNKCKNQEKLISDQTTTYNEPSTMKYNTAATNEFSSSKRNETSLKYSKKKQDNVVRVDMKQPASNHSYAVGKIDDISSNVASWTESAIYESKSTKLHYVCVVSDCPKVSTPTAENNTSTGCNSVPPKLTTEPISEEMFDNGSTEDNVRNNQNEAETTVSNLSKSYLSEQNSLSQKDGQKTENQLRSSEVDAIKPPLEEKINKNSITKHRTTRAADENESIVSIQSKQISLRTFASNIGVDSRMHRNKSMMKMQVNSIENSLPCDCTDRTRNFQKIQTNPIDPIQINENDVVRSSNIRSILFNHDVSQGNEYFQKICTTKRKDYFRFKNSAGIKTMVDAKENKEFIQNIIHAISALDPPGRFIGYDRRTGSLILLDDRETALFVRQTVERIEDDEGRFSNTQKELVEDRTEVIAIASTSTKATKPAITRTGTRWMRELAPFNAAPVAKADENDSANTNVPETLIGQLFGAGGLLLPGRQKRQRNAVSYYRPDQAGSDLHKPVSNHDREDYSNDETPDSESNESEKERRSHKTISEHRKRKREATLADRVSNSKRTQSPALISVPKQSFTTGRSTKMKLATRNEKHSITKRKPRRRSKNRLSQKATRRLATNAIAMFLERNQNGSLHPRRQH